MYTTKLTTSLAAVSLLALGAVAQDIDRNDYPSQCASVCDPVSDSTAQCDQSTGDNDQDYINCVCGITNAATIIPSCEACYANFSKDGHDNDVNDLIRSCSFTTTSYNPLATSSGMASGTTAGAVITTSATVSGSRTEVTTTAAAGAGTSASGSESAAVTSMSSDATAAPASTGAASANSVAGGVGLVAGLVGAAALL